MSSVSVGATTVAIYSYLGSGRLFGKELSEANVVSRGSSIDSIILRDKDANTAWTTASDGVLEERRYYCQNWRSDVSVIVKTNGDVVEWIKYSAYGVPTRIDPADYNRDGFADAVDSNAFDTDYLAPNNRADVNFDDSVNVTDYNLFYANWNNPGETGRGVLSRSDSGNRVGYAGYQHAQELTGTKWHVRHRVLDSELGRWTRRDPLEYVDGTSFVTYSRSNPTVYTDGFGLKCHPTMGCPAPLPKLPSQDPPTPVEPCYTDLPTAPNYGNECARRCNDTYDPQNPRRYTPGMTYGCAFGNWKRCCVCDVGLMNDPLFGPVSTAHSVCTARHERVHRDTQPCPLPTWGTPEYWCQEVPAYQVSAQCFLEQYQMCIADPTHCSSSKARLLLLLFTLETRAYWAAKWRCGDGGKAPQQPDENSQDEQLIP